IFFLVTGTPRTSVGTTSGSESTPGLPSSDTTSSSNKPGDSISMAVGKKKKKILISGSTGVVPGSTVAPGRSSTSKVIYYNSARTNCRLRFTEGTTGPSENQVTGSKTVPTGVAQGTTVAPGSSNTEATTSLGVTGTTENERATGTSGEISGTTITSGSSNTEATTLTGERGSTGSESRTEATTSHGESETTIVGIVTGTTGAGSGTTVLPEGFKTQAMTFKESIRTTGAGVSSDFARCTTGSTVIPESSNAGNMTPAVLTSEAGMQTITTVVSSDIPESSNPGTTKQASKTTTVPGISTTGEWERSRRKRSVASLYSPSETTVAAGDQETENKSECPPVLPQTPVCHGPLGEEKSPGDVWTANCHKCTCTAAKTVDCKPKECPSPPACKTGESLRKFKSNETCCEVGYCEPKTCLFNNTDYEIGASFDDPNNPCLSYSCSDTGFIAVLQDCPKQTWCAKEDRTYDSKKCCYSCNKNNCRTSPVNVTVKFNGCKKRVEMTRCTGDCKKTVRYNYDIFQLESSCHCCQEENYEYRELALDCPDGSTKPYKYRHTTTCSCLDKCQQSTTTVS
uniref:Submaxillary mucin-like protein n=1 Tax=Loxodonta africana TaxID=9785 RepID=G3UN01_LOXAF